MTKTRSLSRKAVLTKLVKGYSKKKTIHKAHKPSSSSLSSSSSSSLGAQLLRKGGRALGSLIGMGDIGEEAGSLFARITGMGAYKVHSNSIMNDSTQAPVFEENDNCITISHSELVTDVQGSTAFTSRSFMIDPMNNVTFPYLSSIAQNFEQYEFKGLVFTYKPTSGSAIASTNNALGTVVVSTEYDVSRPTFSNKVDMEAYQFATSSSPDKMMYHPVECNPKKEVFNNRYITGPYRRTKLGTFRDTTGLSVEDNMNFLGRTQLATVGMQAATTVGELWVSYKIKLSVCRRVGPSNAQGFFHVQSATPLAIGSGSALAASYNVISDSTSSMSNVSITQNIGDTQFQFQGLAPGTRVVANAFFTSTGAGTISAAPWTATNMTATPLWISASGILNVSAYNQFTAQATCTASVCAVVPDNGLTATCTLTLQAPTIATATAHCDVQIFIIPIMNPSVSSIAPYIITAQEQTQELQENMQKLLDMYEEHNDNQRSVMVYEADFEERKEPPPSTPTLFRRK